MNRENDITFSYANTIKYSFHSEKKIKENFQFKNETQVSIKDTHKG